MGHPWFEIASEVESVKVETSPCVVQEGAVFEVILKRFEEPDEVREFEKGKYAAHE